MPAAQPWSVVLICALVTVLLGLGAHRLYRAFQLRERRRSATLLKHGCEDIHLSPDDKAWVQTIEDHISHGLLQKKAEDLMQKVRALGHIPNEHKPEENLLAQQLHKAQAAGHMEDYEQELRDVAEKDRETEAASTATERAARAESLMAEVRAPGHMPKESHDPTKTCLARRLRDTHAAGLMVAHEAECMESSCMARTS